MRNFDGNEMKMNKIDGEEALKKSLEKATEARRRALSDLTLRDFLVGDRR